MGQLKSCYNTTMHERSWFNFLPLHSFLELAGKYKQNSWRLLLKALIHPSILSNLELSHGCSRLRTVSPALRSFSPYVCPSPRTPQVQTNRCSTTGNCGGSMEHRSDWTFGGTGSGVVKHLTVSQTSATRILPPSSIITVFVVVIKFWLFCVFWGGVILSPSGGL